MTVWKPIETAPKDRWVMLYSQNDGVHIGHWDPNFDWWNRETARPGWTDGSRNVCDELEELENVTHWMPLPEPPAV